MPTIHLLIKLPPSLFTGSSSKGETQHGEVLFSLQNPRVVLNTLSSAVYHDGSAYMGSITGNVLLRYDPP
ncbi:MAG: hypothetical protein GYB68_15860 [Chloroflexi bacterium]|nr:hypothetical protein [Chloroflexota bacterium]